MKTQDNVPDDGQQSAPQESRVDEDLQCQTAAADQEAAAASEMPEKVESDPLTVLQEQVTELQGRLLRERADFDNIRKRLRRETDEAGTRAVLRFVRPLLIELDTFQLALSAANPQRFQDFAVGVSMIKANIDSLLAQHQIEQIPCEGVFDPRFHEVMQECEAADRERGEIVEVLRSGWKLGDQVVRAAQVIVARPPPAATVADEASCADAEPEQAEPQ